jgi:hypothetical protein
MRHQVTAACESFITKYASVFPSHALLPNMASVILDGTEAAARTAVLEASRTETRLRSHLLI